MKLLATGDWHCGSGLDYGRTPQDRLADQEQTYQRIVDVAIEHDVDTVVLAGDLWHRRRPTPAELLAVARPLRRLRAESTCDIVAISGNHDVESADSPIALELLEDVLDVYRQPAVVETRAGALALLPWTPVSRLVASRGGGDRDDTHDMAAQLLLDVCRELRSQHDGRLVLVPHWSISGASTPTGVQTDEFREPVIDVGALEALDFDAILAGHIHRPQGLGSSLERHLLHDHEPHITTGSASAVYVGSPAPVDFGEEQSPHGVWVLDLDGPLVSQFVPIESRPFVTLDLDGAQMQTLPGTQWQDVADAVVRVRYRATEEQARRVDHGAIARALYDAAAHKVFAIQPDIIREGRARVEGASEDIAPLDAVQMWCDANQVEAPPLLDLTTRYLTDVAT